MRSVASVALFLFATILCAHAGSAQFSNPYEPYNRRAALAASDGPATQHASYTKRPDGIEALADRIGVSPTGLDLYQYTDGKGTTAESRFSVGLGGKGLQIHLAW